MRISWFFGFGWVSVLTVVVCGLGIHYVGSPLGWVLYAPFLIVAVYMTVRFRLYSTQPWRRVHDRAMIAYGQLAGREYGAAKQETREFDLRIPCRGLALHLFGPNLPEEVGALLGDGRKPYYQGLVEAYPLVFLKGVDEARRKEVLEGVRRDIEASELGPDILIARAIERKHGRLEAANYLHALLLGQVR